MSRTEYNELKSLNYSGAKQILVSPSHYQAWLKAEQEDTPALRFGRLVHLASLEPQVFDRTVRVMPECDRRTKEGKAIFEAFSATLRADEECIKKDEMDKVLAVAESAQAGIEKICGGVEGARLVENTYIGTHEGTPIKGRPDLVVAGSERSIVLDVKTTQDASPKAFARDVYNYKYFLQAAWYCKLTGAKEFYFIAVEKEPPYAFAIYRLDEEGLELGRKLMTSACLTYRECNNFGAWPSYSSEVQTISLPKWANSDSIDV